MMPRIAGILPSILIAPGWMTCIGDLVLHVEVGDSKARGDYDALDRLLVTTKFLKVGEGELAKPCRGRWAVTGVSPGI